jgi:hypothetical protein
MAADLALHRSGFVGRARQALNFYVYFGTISPDRIRACGKIDYGEVKFTFEPGISEEDRVDCVLVGLAGQRSLSPPNDGSGLLPVAL